MLHWEHILDFAANGNPAPDREVHKTDEAWQAQLSPEQFRVTRQHGTEHPFSSEMCERVEPGLYACVCCDTALFDATEKFDSGTGWPSFTQAIKENAVAYHADNQHAMTRVETLCNTCDAHLGHVFPDGPPPSSLRYCINSVALKKVESNRQKVTLGGGCFWCTEAIFQQLKGVHEVQSGFSGGSRLNPSYQEVCAEDTGHAEVIEITYDPEEISYEEIVRVHLGTHDPTTPNQQGADRGTRYRSVVFYRTEEEQVEAKALLAEYQKAVDRPVATELELFEAFFPAEAKHQDYYQRNQGKPYCNTVIEPKLSKFRLRYAHLLHENS